MAEQFISDAEFTSTSKRILKWKTLPMNVTFRVREVNEQEIDMEDGKKKMCKFAVLEDRDGRIKKVWLTSIVTIELQNYNFATDKVYIRSYGLVTSKKGNRQYYDFDIVKKD